MTTKHTIPAQEKTSTAAILKQLETAAARDKLQAERLKILEQARDAIWRKDDFDSVNRMIEEARSSGDENLALAIESLVHERAEYQELGGLPFRYCLPALPWLIPGIAGLAAMIGTFVSVFSGGPDGIVTAWKVFALLGGMIVLSVSIPKFTAALQAAKPWFREPRLAPLSPR